MEQHNELSWRVGGPQGSGVDTAASMFARACAAGRLYMFGRREYYSNIMGRHSYYDVRVADHPLTCHTDTVDLLTTFEAETLVRHAGDVVPGGGIIYDVGVSDVPLDRIQFLDQRVREDLSAYLRERELPESTAGIIEDARQRGVQLFPVSYSQLTSALAQAMGVPTSVAGRALNTFAVAISCALLCYDAQYLVMALEKTFAGKQAVIDMNVRAVEIAYEFVRDNLDVDAFHMRLVPRETGERLMYINGNQATALGKLAGGMTFQTYYPISPATDESTYLEAHATFPVNGKPGGVVIVQTEDELAAVGMAIGAALTGARSATATSGPGFSLMVEGLGWAGANEVPLVITLYQRGSPSTGMPTRTEQGDLRFAIYGGHGEFPRIVLASGDVTECFYDAAQAFNYAERYQMPVIHLLDKALATMSTTLPPFDLEPITIERGELYSPNGHPGANGHYERFRVTETGVSPRALLGQPGGRHWLTGGEHTPDGHVTEDPVVRDQMMEKRARKLELAAREIPEMEKLRVHGDPEAAFTIVSWGSTKGALLEALERLAADGVAVRFIQVRLLWPFPAAELNRHLKRAQPLVVVESNFSGQFAGLLREQTGHTADYRVVKYNGRPMSGQELHAALMSIIEGTAERKVVLRHGN